jgi:hypothetical protein
MLARRDEKRVPDVAMAASRIDWDTVVVRGMVVCAEADLQLAIVEDMAAPRATQLFKLSLAALVTFLSVTVALLTHTIRIERS